MIRFVLMATFTVSASIAFAQPNVRTEGELDELVLVASGSRIALGDLGLISADAEQYADFVLLKGYSGGTACPVSNHWVNLKSGQVFSVPSCSDLEGPSKSGEFLDLIDESDPDGVVRYRFDGVSLRRAILGRASLPISTTTDWIGKTAYELLRDASFDPLLRNIMPERDDRDLARLSSPVSYPDLYMQADAGWVVGAGWHGAGQDLGRVVVALSGDGLRAAVAISRMGETRMFGEALDQLPPRFHQLLEQ